MTLDKVLNVYRQMENRGDVYQFLKDENIDLLYQDMKEPSKLFMFQMHALILIRNGLEQEEYYILHELGHYLMHKDIVGSAYGYGRAELEANMFACIYLLQGNLLNENSRSSLLAKGVPPKDITIFMDSLYQYVLIHHEDDLQNIKMRKAWREK
ncbi:ImmA/IrrE family metallo-endopeptidase [Amedibacillus sp. YH-ame6]